MPPPRIDSEIQLFPDDTAKALTPTRNDVVGMVRRPGLVDHAQRQGRVPAFPNAANHVHIGPVAVPRELVGDDVEALPQKSTCTTLHASQEEKSV